MIELVSMYHCRLLLATVFASSLVQISGPSPVGSVAGLVTNGVTGAPMAGVTVTLGPLLERGASRKAITDASGRFRFLAVAADRYSLSAASPGYVAGVVALSAAAVDVLPDQQLQDLRLVLWPTGGISGVVMDDIGEPAIGVGVVAIERVTTAGRSQNAGRVQRARTNDRGEYRIVGLKAGSYLVAVPFKTVAGSKPSGISTLFYPASTLSSGASIVVIRPGEVQTGIDMHLKEPRRVHIVSGAIAGQLDVQYDLRLVPVEARNDQTEFEIRETKASAAGAFSFPNVPVGQYVLSAVGFPRSKQRDGVRGDAVVAPPDLLPTPLEPTRWGETVVTVAEGGAGTVTIAVGEAARISGRIVFDGASPVPPLTDTPRVFVLATPVDGSDWGDVPLARIEADGSFRTVGLPPGRYELFPFLLWNKWRAWSLKSITVGGRDVSGGAVEVGATPLDARIILTDRPLEVSGVVSDSQGKAVTGASVYLFSTDPARRYTLTWSRPRFACVMTDEKGFYLVRGLLPGDYFAAAVDPKSSLSWDTDASLGQLERQATKVRLDDGQKATLNLRTSRQ